MDYEIIAGILEKGWNEIERRINLAKPFAKTIQIDILDGKLFANTTFLDPKPFKKYSQDIFLELHMMVKNPIEYLEPWAEAGFKRFIGHIEGTPDQAEFIEKAKHFGEVGLAFDGPTSFDALKVPLENLDVVLCMAIESGFSGRSFNTEYLEKIKLIREKSGTIPIEVDGGINDQTIALAKKIGANRFSATSFIFKTNNPEEQYRKLQEAINF